MALKLIVGGVSRPLTSEEELQVAQGLGLARGWSNVHGFVNSADSGVDHLVWPGFGLPGIGAPRGGASLGAGVAYVGGTRVHFPSGSIAAQASKDHYLDLTIDGALVVGVVDVGAAAPAKPPNSIRVARVTTNSTAVTVVSTGFKDTAQNWVGNYISHAHASSHRAIAQAFTAGTASLVYGTGTTRHDNANIHSEAALTERFYAPSSGLYLVTCTIRIPSGQTAQDVALGVRVNGTALEGAEAVGDAASDRSITLSAQVPTQALDYLSIAVTCTAALNVSSSSVQITRVA
jgi:hypothetical protein